MENNRAIIYGGNAALLEDGRVTISRGVALFNSFNAVKPVDNSNEKYDLIDRSFGRYVSSPIADGETRHFYVSFNTYSAIITEKGPLNTFRNDEILIATAWRRGNSVRLSRYPESYLYEQSERKLYARNFDYEYGSFMVPSASTERTVILELPFNAHIEKIISRSLGANRVGFLYFTDGEIINTAGGPIQFTSTRTTQVVEDYTVAEKGNRLYLTISPGTATEIEWQVDYRKIFEEHTEVIVDGTVPSNAKIFEDGTVFLFEDGEVFVFE